MQTNPIRLSLVLLLSWFKVGNCTVLLYSVYSEKLQMSVKPGTVKKFKRLYMNKPTVHSDTTTTIDLLHSSINVLNQVSIKLYSLT